MSDKRLRLCMIGAGNHSSPNIYPCFHFLAEPAEELFAAVRGGGSGESSGPGSERG
jgi:hypothetical protein